MKCLAKITMVVTITLFNISPLHAEFTQMEDSRANFELGKSYKDGVGVKQDDTKALKLFRQAANNGNSNAQNALGYMYHEGRGVKGDIYEAEKWFNKAIEQENPNAQYNLAMIIMSKSMGTEDDKAKVDELLKKAADQDHLQAQILWASMGKYGADKALHVIRKAAAANNEQGMLQLGDLYYKGKYGLEKNYYETVKWWSKAADLGSISARKELGEMYFYGRNNEKGEIVMSIDKQKAVALYKVAAESNIKTITPDEIIDLYFVLDVSHRAQQKVQRRLGDIYLEGDGVLQDKKTAKRYFGMACINGSDYSCEKYKKIK